VLCLLKAQHCQVRLNHVLTCRQYPQAMRLPVTARRMAIRMHAPMKATMSEPMNPNEALGRSRSTRNPPMSAPMMSPTSP